MTTKMQKGTLTVYLDHSCKWCPALRRDYINSERYCLYTGQFLVDFKDTRPATCPVKFEEEGTDD